MSVQPNQSFRDGFSVGGMSQVILYFLKATLAFLNFILQLILNTRYQDFLGDDFKSQGSHVPYNVADFSTQVGTLFVVF